VYHSHIQALRCTFGAAVVLVGWTGMQDRATTGLCPQTRLASPPPSNPAVSLPEAKNMEPRQLQRAVLLTMAELRKGRVRRLLDWGKSLYRVGAIGYGAFSMFTNPWVAKAVLAALWSCLRLVGRMVL
jgi:hypothetical protein